MRPKSPASLQWFATFADAAGEAAVYLAPDQDLLAQFDAAAALGRFSGRPIKSMWVIDRATARVFRTHGPVPGWVAETKKPPAPSLTLEQTSPRRRRRPF